MLFYFTLALMDHLIGMEITNKNSASGGGTSQSSKMPLNLWPTNKNKEVKITQHRTEGTNFTHTEKKKKRRRKN